MSNEHTLAGPEPIMLPPDGGTHLHFLNNLATIKAPGGDHGLLSVVEFSAPRGFGPPLHRHNQEDELFVVMEGTLHLMLGDERFVAEPGAYAVLPRAVPHMFQVVSDTARFLNVTASTDGHPRFDQMVAALGVDTDTLTIPEPMDIDPGQVAEVCARFGIDILGPPPPPLD